MTEAEPAPEPVPRVRMLAKPGCHLCDDARAVIAGVCADLGEGFEEVDVTGDPELFHRYAEEIPVTFVDGKQHDFWRVDADRLRTALAAPHHAPSPETPGTRRRPWRPRTARPDAGA